MKRRAPLQVLVAAAGLGSLLAPLPAAGQAMVFDADAYVLGIAAFVGTQLVPKYTMSLAPGHVDHGLLWEVAGGIDPLQGGVSVAYYPGSHAVAGRLTLRLRLLSILGFEDVQCCQEGMVSYRNKERLRVSAGLGGYLASGAAAGPRMEVRLAGYLLWRWGLFAAAAYEPDLTGPVRHRGEITIGFEFQTPVDSVLDESRVHSAPRPGPRVHFF